VAGTGTYDVIYTISGLCGNADTISILVNPAPTANLSTTDETCTGNYDGTASVSGSGGTPPYTYLWQTSATTANITGLAPGSYTVIVSDANDCTFTGTANILGSPTPCEVVIPVVYLPSVFSPNGDGENDVLYVRGQGIASFELRIYDRWGEMVFQTTDLSSGWDGSFRGRKMDNGSFVYMLQVDFSNGEQLKEKGSISIIK
jgi:gliding motility-associated-like protein